MNPIKVLVVEDELVIAMHLCNQLLQFGYSVLPSVTNYNSAVEVLDNDKPDIAILDIKLEGEKTGVDLAQYIHENIHIPFIFLTSLTDSRTFDKAKTLNPSAYLVKPFNNEDLYRSIELALYKFHKTIDPESTPEDSDLVEKDAFIIRMNNLFSRVNFSDIVFARSEHVYIELHTRNNNVHLIRSTMDGILKTLPPHFCRVHRSYIINTAMVESFGKQSIKIEGASIPIGRSYIQNLENRLKL